MGLAKARLLAASLALAAWVGWLGYQAWSRGRDYPVLSHSQFLVSTLDVVADVSSGADGQPNPDVIVREVHWPAGMNDLVGKAITVRNLSTCLGYRGPGAYILPLVGGDATGEHRVAGLPRSPGFDTFASPPHFVYPDLPITRQQLAVIRKP